MPPVRDFPSVTVVPLMRTPNNFTSIFISHFLLPLRLFSSTHLYAHTHHWVCILLACAEANLVGCPTRPCVCQLWLTLYATSHICIFAGWFVCLNRPVRRLPATEWDTSPSLRPSLMLEPLRAHHDTASLCVFPSLRSLGSNSQSQARFRL